VVKSKPAVKRKPANGRTDPGLEVLLGAMARQPKPAKNASAVSTETCFELTNYRFIELLARNDHQDNSGDRFFIEELRHLAERARCRPIFEN
jgi:hypothetical protein